MDNDNGKKEDIMNGILENEIGSANWWAAGEKPLMEFCLEDEMDNVEFLDMGYSMEPFLTGDMEDM